MKEYDAKKVLDSNEYEDLISPKELQNPSVWKRLRTSLSKFIRGNETHPRISRSSGIKYKDENGKTVEYISSDFNDSTKTYLDKNGRCIVEHAGPEHIEHTVGGADSRSGKSIREIYPGTGKSGTPKIEEVSWIQKQMPDGTFERVEDRMLFDSMADYLKHKEDLELHAEIMGKDYAISADLMYKHVRASAHIQYNQDGYDMRVTDLTPRTYNPGKGDVQLKAQTTSHIVKNKEGYTKEVTYREPGHYNNRLGASHEHIQIHPIMDGRYNLTEHSYDFESKDVKMSQISLDAPMMPNSDVSKLSGEYMEVNGKVLQATGSQSLLFEQKDNQLVRHSNPNVQKVIEEFHRRKEMEDAIESNPNEFRFIIDDKGKSGIFVMNDRGYGDSAPNLEQLKKVYGDVSRSTGIDQNCKLHTAGSKNPSDTFFSRSSKMALSDIQVETLKQADNLRNDNNRNTTLSHNRNRETDISKLDER